ncbi:MAG TPA: LutB/LldF family L-lactate oxidation iron-sulfur protein [Acidobacteriota bacterium]|nr:LutB/LldF family L-lactate oxidation iron-sulfur protein [Acidobacteriota bacterium]
MIEIRRNTARALADDQLQRNLAHALGHTLQARDRAVGEVEDWEQLRRYARQVKAHTLARLDRYLGQLEGRVKEQGGEVIWARDAQEACRFIVELAGRKGVREVVKSKTMAGEEIHLNQALEQAGIVPVESDLGEYLVQLEGVPPSHIIAPALHLSRGDAARLMHEKVGMELTEDVQRITAEARRQLRRRFLEAGMGISGVNFAVAESGTLVVVENEGNARLSVSAPPIHVAVMGLEKVVPRVEDLAVLLKVLIRSATGQSVSSYINFLNGPRREGEIDGPDEFYLVLIDNGRSRILADEHLRETLYCLRCGACQNVCPVYQRIGGHAYESTYQGPIGAILTPQLLSLQEAPEHPFASSLCGACQEVCPVGIEIPRILLELRGRAKKRSNAGSKLEAFAWRLWSLLMTHPRLYSATSAFLRHPLRVLLHLGLTPPPLNRWTVSRHLPAVPAAPFRSRFPAD